MRLALRKRARAARRSDRQRQSPKHQSRRSARKNSERKSSVVLSGGKQQTKITADIQALRREMQEHNASLQQSREAAQQERKAVEDRLHEKGAEPNEKRGDLTDERRCLQRVSTQLSMRCIRLEVCQQNLLEQQAALEKTQKHWKNSITRLRKVVTAAKAAVAKAVEEQKSIKPPLPPTESPLPPPLPPPLSPTMTPPRCLPPQMQPTVTPPKCLPPQDALPLAMPLHSASASSELSSLITCFKTLVWIINSFRFCVFPL